MMLEEELGLMWVLLSSCTDLQELSSTEPSVQINERTAKSYVTGQRLRDLTLLSIFTNIGAFSQRHNSVKLGLILVGLWVLNWIY